MYFKELSSVVAKPNIMITILLLLWADDLWKIKPNILIDTPKIFLKAVEDDASIFQRIHRLVLDEPDKTFIIIDFEQLKLRHKKLKK